MDTRQLLIEILRSELTENELAEDTKAKLTPEVLAALFKLSKSHDLAHIVANALGKLSLMGTDDVSAAYQKQQVLSVFRCERIKYELSELCRVLDEAEIPYMLLKGSVIRPYYPIDSMRTSSDIDVFVKSEDIDAVTDAIEKNMSYDQKELWMNVISYMGHQNVHIEIHYYDASHDEEKFGIIKDAWQLCENTVGYRYDLPGGYFLAYHFAHMAKHFAHGGCGIRPFMDLWIMEQKMGIDRHCADELLEQYGLYEFARGSYELTDAWFGGKEHTSLSEDMQNYLMGAGIYGSAENAMVASQVKKGRLGHLLEKVFLSYPQMKTYYPSLAKCPILFPFYQVRRWCRILFCGGRKRALNYIKDSNAVSKDKQNAVDDIFTRLNIKE